MGSYVRVSTTQAEREGARALARDGGEPREGRVDEDEVVRVAARRVGHRVAGRVGGVRAVEIFELVDARERIVVARAVAEIDSATMPEDRVGNVGIEAVGLDLAGAVGVVDLAARARERTRARARVVTTRGGGGQEDSERVCAEPSHSRRYPTWTYR